ncbi:CoA transferase [Rhodococcus sp. WS3]|uniref:CaiB/BaiF CoA transferase family protein n=1 Tax=unclassified Rhodococcus (in: high G+C Gram-positive bacteria) TaxID=192944 RepID=UPI0011426885|nr:MULTISPECIES: CaiB/BaiF CoA-transferase family protein [unclassified Rhodococcus (in: high G+C Gram-positive bacteria)]ROZ46282.1 CoA transferase [Rhodococcus sp. WS3]RZL24939.1 MAG: CoA transferase [Rhodococcus sp. (in: high G+C Gram-positive bacteria)]
MAPLDGINIVEFGGIGPGPFAGMLLADLGANVIRLHRHGEKSPVDLGGSGADHRSRPGIPVDLKNPRDVELAVRLVDSADALIEGFRPGVMERLGLGPDRLLARNPKLVYGRITGYGQDGPLAKTPGHDINYIAMSGVLSALARVGERPLAPINLLGDYGGGGMLLAFGVLGALLQAQRTGEGEVVDAAMVDGVAQLATIVFSFSQAGAWGAPGTNVIDSGAHFYDVYETSDGLHFAVGAIEPQFYSEFIRLLDLTPEAAPQWDRSRWAELKERIAGIFKTKTRAEWSRIFEGTDACATPVLGLEEAAHHPHNLARQSFVQRAEGLLPATAPRFSSTKSAVRETPSLEQALELWGFDDLVVSSIQASSGISS